MEGILGLFLTCAVVIYLISTATYNYIINEQVIYPHRFITVGVWLYLIYQTRCWFFARFPELNDEDKKHYTGEWTRKHILTAGLAAILVLSIGDELQRNDEDTKFDLRPFLSRFNLKRQQQLQNTSDP